MPSQRPDSSPADEPDFEQALQAVEQSLQMLKARYSQVQLDQQQQQNLQQRLSQAERESRRGPALRRELKQIRQQLDDLELALESRLFSWSGLREVFWQAVRFGGLGVIIGWLLKSLAG
jgi:predicted RNase H-like nuclease (RuvC/YqgF family)